MILVCPRFAVIATPKSRSRGKYSQNTQKVGSLGLCASPLNLCHIDLNDFVPRLSSVKHERKIDDCYEVWLWFLDRAEELGVDASRIAVAGQSAGGGLTAALCQRIRDEGGVTPAAQLLIYPMLDDRAANREELTKRDHLIWNNCNNLYGWSAYSGRAAGSNETTPRWAVPGRFEDLSSLPPTWIGTGDLDLFLDENKKYAADLGAQGVPCELYIAEKAPHAFESMVPDVAVSRRFVGSADEFLKIIFISCS